jgi:hypothetical protein
VFVVVEESRLVCAGDDDARLAVQMRGEDM